MSLNFFQYKRFSALIQLEFKSHLRKNLLRLLVMYAALAGSFLFISFVNIPDVDNSRDTLIGNMFGISCFMLVIFGLASASYMFETMGTKQGRVNLLMLPATTFEKFFIRWLVYVPFFVVCFFASAYLADVTRYLVMSTLYPEVKCFQLMNMIPLGIDFCRVTGESTVLCTLIPVTGFLAFQSFFVLGSAFFPRNAATKTVGVLIGWIALYVLYTLLIGKLLLPDNNNMYADPEGLTLHGARVCLVIFFSLFSLFMWILAYMRFKESEVIHRF